MPDNTAALVRLVDGNAQVSFDNVHIHVVPRDKINNAAGCPMHLLVSAFGACIALTLDAVARNKGIDVKDLKVRIDHSRLSDGTTRFNVLLNLNNGLSDRERKILHRSARSCEVGNILKGNVQIDYGLLDNAPHEMFYQPETQ